MAQLVTQDERDPYSGVTAGAPIAPSSVVSDDVGGDTFANTPSTRVYVENPTGSPIDIVFSVTECRFGELHALTVTVAANDPGSYLGRLLAHRFSAAGALAEMNYSAPGLRVAAVRI